MSYADKSRAKDFEQHAAKIRLGLQNLSPDDAKRAIWELFQNAVDLSPTCHIRISVDTIGLKFEHNGKPFDEDSLACLIKQLSSKEQGTTEGEVGQYGTGFITTHIYGKRIEINGAVQVEDGFIPLTSFILDRKEEGTKSLQDKIQEQDKLAEKIINEALGKTDKPSSTITSFHYIADQKESFDCIETAIGYLEEICPLVFAFNDRLSLVEIQTSKKSITYRRREPKSESGYRVINIAKDGTPLPYICLFSEDNTVRVILPFDQEFNLTNQIISYPKLFLFYPLIGSETSGINFIFHSNSFQPKEKRDSLYLSFDNSDIEQKVEANRKAIKECFILVSNFLSKNSLQLKETYTIANVFLTDLPEKGIDSDFWEEQKREFVQKILSIKLVDTLEGRKSISECLFFDTDLLLDPSSELAIHGFASQFWKNIPIKEEIRKWSDLVKSWNISTIKFVKASELLAKAQICGNLSNIHEQENYKLFLIYVANFLKPEELEKYSVLPNIYGTFLKYDDLKEPLRIDSGLISVAEILFKKIPEAFVHTDYSSIKSFRKYNREDYKKEINQKAGEISDALDKGTSVRFEEIRALIQFMSLNATSTLTKALYDHFSSFYELNFDIVLVQNADNDFDYRPVNKALFRYFIADINLKGKDWLKINLTKLTNALSLVYQNDDFKRTLLPSIRAYPNQNFILCSQKDLKIDPNIPPRLKEIYNEVKKVDVKDDLALLEISNLLNHFDKIDPSDLGRELEDIFDNEKLRYIPITAHDYKGIILEIVQYIIEDKLQWKYWFQRLNASKMEVLVGKITAPALRTSMFSILTKSDATIALLGQLADVPNLSEIIKAGNQKLEEDKQVRTDFRIKWLLGTHIEKLVRERIADLADFRTNNPEKTIEDIEEIRTMEEQNGQDIVLYRGEVPIYYIEVKSRWNLNTPFRISRNQTIKAFKNKERYSLITVDLTEYIASNKHELTNVSEIEKTIKVNTDLGEKINYNLVELYENSNENEIFHIDGDFRTFVPLHYVKSGKTLNEFEAFLTVELEKIYAE